MAGKKKEGLDGLKDTTGGKRREDRQANGRTVFDLLTIDAKNATTVMYLLQSPEDSVLLKAVASLENFGNKDPENLKLLTSIGIFEHLFPLIYHHDYIIRRFTLKLIGMLSSLEEFRCQMLEEENILEAFVVILKKETDAVLQEYSSLTLAQLSSEYQVASDLLRVEDSLDTLLQRITSPDPDIQKNCLDIMMHLLVDVKGIETIIESPSFDIKVVMNLIFSSYPVIQTLAIEVLTELTSWCRDSRVLFIFRDALGIETILQVLENEDWTDLHTISLNLLVNVMDCPDMCDYLLQSGCLYRFVCLLDTAGVTNMEKILGVLARLSQTKKGQKALHSVEMETRFTTYLEVISEGIQEQCCLGIANMAQNLASLNSIIEAKPMKYLLGIATSNEKNTQLRNMAAYALNILSNADKKASEALLEEEDYKGLFTILTDSSNLSTELCQNVIQVFIGISLYHELRIRIISENFISALMSCLPNNPCDVKDPSLQVDALECLSEYLVESDARLLFLQSKGVDVLLSCLRSKFASVREWAGHLVVVASQCQEFVKDFIRKDGLDWMLKEKNTMHSMPSWQSAIETIFANCLPAKFAYTGRLDFQDITQDGFYVYENPKIKFVILESFVETMTCPVTPTYLVNFSLPINLEEESQDLSEATSSVSAHSTGEPQNLKKFMKGADRNSLEEYIWNGSLDSYPSVDYQDQHVHSSVKSWCRFRKDIRDPHLNEYLENLKKKITKEEIPLGDKSWSSIHPTLICKRARIIARFVAEEMTGPDPGSPCSSTTMKVMHMNELKWYLGSNIFPLGLIRAGDYLERAVLFKVLADRIGFPCALVRGSFGRAWIEIAVPVINIEDLGEESQKEKNFFSVSKRDLELETHQENSQEDSSEITVTYNGPHEITPTLLSVASECGESDSDNMWYSKLYLESFKGYPSDFLKPNVIVDLVIEPGRLLNINSLEAEEYCGGFLL